MDNYIKLWDELYEWIKQKQNETNDDISQWIYTSIRYKMAEMVVEYYKDKFKNN